MEANFEILDLAVWALRFTNTEGQYLIKYMYLYLSFSDHAPNRVFLFKIGAVVLLRPTKKVLKTFTHLYN